MKDNQNLPGLPQGQRWGRVFSARQYLSCKGVMKQYGIFSEQSLLYSGCSVQSLVFHFCCLCSIRLVLRKFKKTDTPLEVGEIYKQCTWACFLIFDTKIVLLFFPYSEIFQYGLYLLCLALHGQGWGPFHIYYMGFND